MVYLIIVLRDSFYVIGSVEIDKPNVRRRGKTTYHALNNCSDSTGGLIHSYPTPLRSSLSQVHYPRHLSGQLPHCRLSPAAIDVLCLSASLLQKGLLPCRE